MERVWRQLEPPVRSIGRGLEEILLKDDRNPKEWKTAVHREGNRARRAVQPWNENVPECPRGKNHGRRSGEEELWKHRAVTMRGKVVRLPCRSRRPSADPPRGEIHSFFRLAAEITFRHSVEKKEGGGMKSARFRKLLSDGILNRRSRLSLSEIILAHLFALYRLRILINRG